MTGSTDSVDSVNRLVVAGASGFLGRTLFESAADRFDVLGTFHETPIESDAGRVLQTDLTEPPFTDLRAFDPDAIVNCAALADVDGCERNPSTARRLNRTLPATVAEFADATDTRLVHVSTDAVFDGSRPLWSEVDEPNPVNVYGETKHQGERAVLARNDDALVVRTNFFGWGDGGTLAEWMLSTLEAGDELTGLSDVYFSPMYVGDLADRLFELLETDGSGVLHLPGSQRRSKLEFARDVAAVFDLPADRITSIRLDDLDLDAPRPKDVSLDGTRASDEYDLELPRIRDGLERMRAERDA